MLGFGSLRCGVGRHAPRGGGVWNHGYCFTTCERCGRDMVRSVFGEWHVPKGFRVVADGDARAVAGLDAVMTARDGRDAPPLPPEPAPAQDAAPIARRSIAAPSSPARPAAAGSPFDFEDFDAIDPAAMIFADPPPQPDRTAPPISRAAP